MNALVPLLWMLWGLVAHPVASFGDASEPCATPTVTVATDFDDELAASAATVSLCWPWDALATDDDDAADVFAHARGVLP